MSNGHIDGNYTTAEKELYNILRRLGVDVGEIQSQEPTVGELITIVEEAKKRATQEALVSAKVLGFEYSETAKGFVMTVAIPPEQGKVLSILARAQHTAIAEFKIKALVPSVSR